MNRNLIIAPIMVMVAGCAQFGAYKEEAKQTASVRADMLLTAAIWWTCDASPIGAVRRRFGTTEFTASVYRAFCLGGVGVQLFRPVSKQVQTEELPE